MPDTLKIATVKPVLPREGYTVRAILTEQDYSELKNIQDKTGIALSQLTRLCVEYALPKIEIVEM